MKLRSKLSVCLLGFTLFSGAQNNTSLPKDRCGTQVPSVEWDTWFNQKVDESKRKMAKGTAQFYSYTIPVVVHIIHGNQSVGVFPNVSEAQVKSQINVLNNDFAGNGYNVSQLAATAFSAVGAANCYITFCLAQFDPNGSLLTTPGIDRKNYISQGWTNPTVPTDFATFKTLMDGTIKPATIWDPTRYLNIWVSDANNAVGLLGYATFPAGSGLTGLPATGSAQTDGIWVWAGSFGSTGSQAPYNFGRTATHELGHWLGLRHIGGDGNGNVNGDCNATDYCNDTPPQKGGLGGGQYGQNFGAGTYPLHPNTCSPNNPNGDMFMNFMDYSDDAYCYMFTPDQNARIQAAMENGTYRNQLSASSVSLCSGAANADFYIEPTNCISQEVSIMNQSGGTAVVAYTWSASPDSAVVFSPDANDPNPTINFPVVGTYTISLIASNAIGISTSYTVVDLADCVGISENSILNKYVSLQPNPSSGIVNLKTDFSSNQVLEVVIYNSLGQISFKKTFTDVSTTNLMLNLENQSNGLYNVMISNGSDKTVKRLILNK